MRLCQLVLTALTNPIIWTSGDNHSENSNLTKRQSFFFALVSYDVSLHSRLISTTFQNTQVKKFLIQISYECLSLYDFYCCNKNLIFEITPGDLSLVVHELFHLEFFAKNLHLYMRY
jgi:hypothetical protein